MSLGIDAAASGMKSIMDLNDILANNMANVNTTGFKKSGIIFKEFQDVLVNKLDGPITSNPSQLGTLSAGSIADKSVLDFSQGGIKSTGNPLDLAINGDGFFVIQTSNGQAYTRNGNFTLGKQGQILTLEGDSLVGQKGPIKINLNDTQIKDIQIGADGTIQANGQMIDKIKIVDFQNKESLQFVGNSLLKPTEGQKLIPTQPKHLEVVQGGLESSNANVIECMVNSITGQRIYDSLAKSVESSNRTLQKDINEVGRIRR